MLSVAGACGSSLCDACAVQCVYVLMCAADWRRKGVIPPNSYSNEIVSSLDVFPTLANLTGAALPTDRPIDGKNMVGGG